MKKFVKNTLFLSAVGIVFLILVWGIACFAVGNEYILPSPWNTLLAMGDLLRESYFYAAFFATLGRALLAFCIACVLGVGLAIVSYLFSAAEKLLRGIVAVLRSLPTMAVLLLILLGVSHAFAPVLIGFLTLFPLVYTSTYSSLCGVDRGLIEMAEVYRVPTRIKVTKLYLPMAFPRLLAEGVAALSFSLKLTVSAEVLAFTYRSIGGWMQEASISAEAETLMALTVLVCLVGVLIEVLGVWLIGRWEAKRCV